MLGATVVHHCPPDTEPLDLCAPAGEDCSRDALNKRVLTGCCAGLLCKAYASGPRICRKGTPTEQALFAECNDPSNAGMGSFVSDLVVDTPLASSRGELPFDRTSHAFVVFGPGGCPSSVDLTLAQGDHDSCSLTLHAGSMVDAEGALVLAPGVTLDARGCSGLPADAKLLYDKNTIGGTLSFDGLNCEYAPFTGPWCWTGSFELTLNGPLDDASAMQSIADEDGGSAAALSFADAKMLLKGRLCGMMTANACPAP